MARTKSPRKRKKMEDSSRGCPQTPRDESNRGCPTTPTRSPHPQPTQALRQSPSSVKGTELEESSGGCPQTPRDESHRGCPTTPTRSPSPQSTQDGSSRLSRAAQPRRATVAQKKGRRCPTEPQPQDSPLPLRRTSRQSVPKVRWPSPTATTRGDGCHESTPVSQRRVTTAAPKTDADPEINGMDRRTAARHSTIIPVVSSTAPTSKGNAVAKTRGCPLFTAPRAATSRSPLPKRTRTAIARGCPDAIAMQDSASSSSQPIRRSSRLPVPTVRWPSPTNSSRAGSSRDTTPARSVRGTSVAPVLAPVPREATATPINIRKRPQPRHVPTASSPRRKRSNEISPATFYGRSTLPQENGISVVVSKGNRHSSNTTPLRTPRDGIVRGCPPVPLKDCYPNEHRARKRRLFASPQYSRDSISGLYSQAISTQWDDDVDIPCVPPAPQISNDMSNEELIRRGIDFEFLEEADELVKDISTRFFDCLNFLDNAHEKMAKLGGVSTDGRPTGDVRQRFTDAISTSLQYPSVQRLWGYGADYAQQTATENDQRRGCPADKVKYDRDRYKTRKEKERLQRQQMMKRVQVHRTRKRVSIFGKWFKGESNVGKLTKRCPFCLALHFPDEIFRCCGSGKVKLPVVPPPPPLILELMAGETRSARKHKKYLCRLNSLFAFGGKQCETTIIPGAGVPVVKIKGTYTHTASSVFDEINPRFGSLYALDPMDAVDARLSYAALSMGCDAEFIYELEQMFREENIYGQMYKSMGEILREAEKKTGSNLKNVMMRIVPKEELMRNPEALKLTNNEHTGRYNTPDNTMVVYLFETDDFDRAKLPSGVNVYPQHNGGPGKQIHFFSEFINPICYPFIHPDGNFDHKNNYVELIAEPVAYTPEQIAALTAGDDSDPEEGSSNEDEEEKEAELEDIVVDDDEEANEVDRGCPEEQIVLFEGDIGAEETVITGDDIFVAPEMNTITLEVDGEEEEVILPTCDEVEDLPVLPAPPQEEADPPDQKGAENMSEAGGVSDAEEEGEEPDTDLDEDPDGTDDVPREDEEPEYTTKDGKKLFSALMHLRYRLRRVRKSKFAHHHILSATRLSQHYIIDNILRIIEQRLWHVQKNQFETADKSAFFNSMANRTQQQHNRRLGMAFTVPHYFKNGPAYLKNKFDDAMAMIGEIGKPDLFCTFTGNRKWPEIERYRRPCDTWADIPDVAVRVFFEKFKQFKDLIVKGKVFGKIKGFAYSIELQQRGMPHAHMLITLADGNKLDTPAKVDDVVWARLPNPDEPGISDEEKKERTELRELVEKHMVHDPCENNPDSYCKQKMKQRKGGVPKHYRRCEKGYPKEYLEETTFVDDGYVQPKRPDDGQYFEKVIDYKTKETVKCTNEHVVPYNPGLLKMFNSHINVEICSTVMATKYIFKYIFKGFDKAIVEFIENARASNGTKGGVPTIAPMVVGGHVILPKGVTLSRAKRAAVEREAKKMLQDKGIVVEENNQKTLIYNECVMLQAMRAVTVAEALLTLYQIPTAVTQYSCVSLAIHEPGKEKVYWIPGKENERHQALQSSAPTSQLTAWFALNAKDDFARTLLYKDIPKHYLWSRTKKCWWKRRERKRKVVSRLYPVSPRYANKFAIRVLAMNVRGCTSFEDMRTLDDGRLCDTFMEAARERGLMNDEREWREAMQAAVATDMPHVIRRLFATICVYCPVKDKEALFNEFEQQMYDKSSTLSPATLRARALYHIESILKNNSIDLEKAELPAVDHSELHWDVDERRSNSDGGGVWVSPEEARRLYQDMLTKMNTEQRYAFEEIKNASDPDCNNRCFFLQGSGGTGKTFVYKALYYFFISVGYNVLMVAHTGIAATLLINGTTVHRQFAVPVNEDKEELRSLVAAESRLEQLIRETEVVIWDEATMSDRRVLDCVNRLLCELEPTDPRPFGGKLMCLGGDWKQLLPVVRSTYGRQILEYTIKRGQLWDYFQVLMLKKNMRVEEGAEDFGHFVNDVGNAALSVQKGNFVTIPQEMTMQTEEEIMEWCYGGGVLDVESCEAIKDTCILSVLNDATLEINEKILDMLPGETHEMFSEDRCSKEMRTLEMPTAIYNAETPTGMPPHRLLLKRGCIVVLLRNLNVPKGQCNGTRMRVEKIERKLLTCHIITPEAFKDEVVLLPRLELEPQDNGSPHLQFTRRQFPVRLAYSMTINKAQGQTLKKVGIILRTPIFTHGQLYVALSRARTREGVRIYQMREGDKRDAVDQDGNMEVRNYVFKEILV